MLLEAITDKIRNQHLSLSSFENGECNVNMPERLLSVVGGAFIMYKSFKQFKQHPVVAAQEALVGGALMYRGATGHCPVYAALNQDSTDSQAVNITETFVVDRPREEVYAFWRKLENLPKFMKHLASVEEYDKKRSQWRANVPGEIVKFTWNAEITREDENSYIGWQSVEGSMVQNAGKVRFEDAVNGLGTELTVDISYFPPAGSLGQGIARLLNGIFEKMVREDVNNFKKYVEGEDYKTYDHDSAKEVTEAPQNTFK